MAGEETRRDWETVQSNERDRTERLRIAGGWLYRVITTSAAVTSAAAVAVVFVPGAASRED